MAWLDANPPRRSQFRRPRRARVRPVCVGHTSESPWPTSNALGVARFIQGRTDPGSYHELVDADRIIDLIDLDAEAFHDATGSNPWSYGVAAACRTIDWARMPADIRQRFLRNLAIAAARCNAHCHARTGLRIEARQITRAQSEAGVAGFIPHGDRDPARRTDWGTTRSAPFPWAEFWPHYLRAVGHPTAAPPPPPPQENPIMSDTLTPAVLNQIRGVIRDEVASQLGAHGMRVVDAVDRADDAEHADIWDLVARTYSRLRAQQDLDPAINDDALWAAAHETHQRLKAQTAGKV